MRLSFIAFLFSAFLFSYSPLFGQVNAVNRDAYRIHIHQTTSEIVIDGIIDEEPWAVAERATDFHRVLPIDTGYAASQTEVMVTYNKSNLYLAVVCYDTLPGRRPVESLRRDWSFPKNDNFIAFIDTYNDQTNGFAFGISAAGAQWDGQQANGGFVSLD